MNIKNTRLKKGSISVIGLSQDLMTNRTERMI